MPRPPADCLDKYGRKTGNYLKASIYTSKASPPAPPIPGCWGCTPRRAPLPPPRTRTRTRSDAPLCSIPLLQGYYTEPYSVGLGATNVNPNAS